MRTRALLLFAFVASACGGADAPRREVVVVVAPVSERSLEVSTELRRQVPGKGPCAPGDACGFFLQILSPGSDAPALAERAARIVRGKCSGRLVVYRDARNVMGAGVVLPSLEAKRACERALGRAEDTDFPSQVVLRVGP